MFESGDSSEYAHSGSGPGDQDPIARNPKDIGKPGGAIEPAKVSQGGEVPAPVVARPIPPSLPWGANQHGHAAPSATELLFSVLRYKWTIVIIFILVSAPIIAAVWTQVIPEYQARAEVRVSPTIPRLVFNTDENGRIPFYDSFVNTQVSIIRSLTVLNRVLEQKDVQATQWYKSPPQSLKERLLGGQVPPMERLRDALSVRPRPRTEIIDVSLTDASASDAKVIVNAVLDQYTKYTAERFSAEDDLIYRQLSEKKKSFEEAISGRENLLARLQKNLGTALPEQLVNSKRIRLEGLQSQLSELEQSIAIIQWEIDPTGGSDSNDVPGVATERDSNDVPDVAAARDSNDVPAVATARDSNDVPDVAIARDSNDVPGVATAEAERPRLYYEDAQWLTLDRNVRMLGHQIANSVYGPNHPGRVRLENDATFAMEELRRREAQLDEQWKNRAITAASMPIVVNDPNRPIYTEGPGSLQHQLARAKHQKDGLLKELDQQQKEFEEAFDTAQMLKNESTQQRYDQELYDAVRTRLDEKNMERGVAGSIDILMRAFSPSRPSKDRRVVFTAMALFVGFGMGGGVAFLRASRNQAIHSPSDIPQPAQVPFLGNIPLVQTRKAPGKSLCEEIERNQFRLLESVRVLRTALLSRLNGQGSAMVLVTSADEGTGKQ